MVLVESSLERLCLYMWCCINERTVTGEQVTCVRVRPVYQLWRVPSCQRPFLWLVFTRTKVCVSLAQVSTICCTNRTPFCALSFSSDARLQRTTASLCYATFASGVARNLSASRRYKLSLLISLTGWPKNGTVFWYALTSSNVNRFSKLFHCQNQEKICNNTVTKDPTTPQVCRCTTLWNVKCLQSNNWKQDNFCNNTFF